MYIYKTRVTYVADGTQKVFSIPFDYLRPLFIKVYFNETLMSYATDYLVANREVRFTVAPPSGVVVEVRRVTDTVPLVSWHDASVLRSSDMTLSQIQNLHVLEEMEDWIYRSGMTYSEALKAWNAQSRRITNVLDPKEPQDVVTLKYIEDVRTGYISEMSNLLGATKLNADKAKASETAAKASEIAAASSETVAKASKTVAKDSADKAKVSETAAKASEVAAKASEVAAKASETSAKDSADKAKVSETAAKASEVAAKASETSATNQADRVQDIVDSLEGLAGITGIATTNEAIAGVVDTKAMTPLKTKGAIEQGTNVFTALNTFRANIKVSNGSAAGSNGKIDIGIKPRDATVQPNISAPGNGNIIITATENSIIALQSGDIIQFSAVSDETNNKTSIYIHSNLAATYTPSNGIVWNGNANTATKLKSAPTINGVVFDGTKDIIVDSNPVGTIIAMSYTGVPEGYMHCNGAAVSRTTYAALFSKIGTYYGAGDGSTTFNLPNTVARFLEGSVAAGTYYEAGLPNITGYFPADTRDMAQGNYGGVFSQTYLNAQADGQSGNSRTYKYTLDASKASNVYGASTTVQPPALTVIYCIKY